MAGNFQPSSFIPKKNLSATGKPSKVTRSVNIFLIIAGIIFVLTLVGAGAAFFYERTLTSSLANKQTSLERARDAFEPRLIEELARLDTRMEVAEHLLDRHITATPFLRLLSENTLRSVQFETFNFARAENGALLVVMDGIAESYGAIALQSELFGNNEYIQDPIFSDFSLENDGTVLFTVELFVDDDLLLYVNNI